MLRAAPIPALLIAVSLAPHAAAEELSRRECRDRLDAFYAEPARRCSPAADEAQTARVAATQGRSQAWKEFYTGCEAVQAEFMAIDAGCEAKFKEGYPNADWRERWVSLEAIDAEVDARLLVFGCARDRDPLLDALTACLGTACTEPAAEAEAWQARCAPERLSEEAAGIGYRKNFELLGTLHADAVDRAAHAELVTRVGEAVKAGRADGLQRALAAPWCSADKSWACALDVSWRDGPDAVLAGLRRYRAGELERTRLGRLRLAGVRDARQRLLVARELRPLVLAAPIEARTGGESPAVRRAWREAELGPALAWVGAAPEPAPQRVDREPEGEGELAAVHGAEPHAVAVPIERVQADVDTPIRKLRAVLGEDGLLAVEREPGRVALVYAVSEDTRLTYVAARDGRDAVLTRWVEHPRRAEASAAARLEAAVAAWRAAGEIPAPEAFAALADGFAEDTLSEQLDEAIDLHVRLLLADGDAAAFAARQAALAPQLDLWAAGRAGSQPAEEELDPELVDPDAPTGPATPRSRAPGPMQLAIGGCAEAAWAEAAEAADAHADRWHREATWAELALAVAELRGEDTFEAERTYRFAMRQLAEALYLRKEAGRLAGERDAFALKSGIERVDRSHPAFALAALLTEAECL